MSSRAVDFNAFIKKASLSELKKLQSSVSTKINELSNAKTVFNHSEYVTHVDFIITEEELLSGALAEVRSLSFNPDKLDSAWINMVDEQYIFNGCNTKKPVQLMSKFPCIMAIMNYLNASGHTTGDLNSCLVTRYPNGFSKLNWHSDDESTQIKQSSSIASFTLGETRFLQIRKKLSHKLKKRKATKIPILEEYEMRQGSVTIMNPGCQSVLEHRVPASSEGAKSGVRFSLSFRHFIGGDEASSCSDDYFSGEEFSPTMPALPSSDTEDVSPAKVIPSPHSPAPKCKTLPSAILMAGDSFMQGLDPEKLKKGKSLNIFNLARSGQTIKQVKRSLVNFSENNGAEYQVRKVLLCAGTNDIRHFNDKGVYYLKSSIDDLIKTAKDLFPSAVIYFQSLIPLPVNNRPFIVEDIDQLNKIIYEACVRKRCYMIDAMSEMLNEYYVRNPALFKRNNIHPNSNGYSVLAKLYLKAIHSKRFNPLGW